MNGMRALIKQTAESSLAFSARGRYNEESVVCHLEGDCLHRSRPCQHP